ncbi:MAG: YdeI/OmpD-associated family protein [Allosphingosinicella sp.]|uniref:YdeI/OmpD-associated family protein n=1 Tax=Allosphingosinicella sp. TaxID=2823234 RepID=UPI00394C56A9
MKRDERVDAYIARQADFARPILAHLRDAVHAACPDAEETLKWGMPAFLYKGGILATMAAFKRHASFGFWRGGEVVGEEKQDGMGQFGRIAAIEDLPEPAALAAMIEKAAALVDEGAKAPRARSVKAPLETPADLRAAIDAVPAAAATFDAFPPSCRRDYVEWVVDAKRPETRAKRIAQAAEWLAEGKRRHWKYEKC